MLSIGESRQVLRNKGAGCHSETIVGLGRGLEEICSVRSEKMFVIFFRFAGE